MKYIEYSRAKSSRDQVIRSSEGAKQRYIETNRDENRLMLTKC